MNVPLKLSTGVSTDGRVPWTTRLAWSLAGASLLAITSWVAAQNTAETGMYRADGANLPISARTRFFDAANNIDLRNTAEHELLHATGFTTGYTLFANKLVTQVIPQPNPGDRDFYSNGNRLTGTLRMTLLPAGSNHLDTALTVNGTDQSTNIMRPDQVNGQRMVAFDAAPLNDAFGWSGRNLAITVKFDPSFPNVAALRNHLTAARDAEQTLFNSNGTGHAFNWTVLNVPAVPRRGDSQQLRTDAPYQSLPNHQLVYQSGNTSVTLTNLSFQFASAPGTHQGGQTDYSTPSTLTADALISSPSTGAVNGTISLAGLSSLAVLDVPGDGDLHAPEVLSANATRIDAMSLTGSFTGPGGTIPLAMLLDPSAPTVGEHNVFGAGPGLYAIDSFFDVFTELSLDGGSFMAADGSVYLGYTPEPGTLALLALGALALRVRRQRLTS